MNRKQFLTTGLLGGISAFFSKFTYNKVKNSANDFDRAILATFADKLCLARQNKPVKWGHLSVPLIQSYSNNEDCAPYDFTVYVNGKLPPENHAIQAAHDIENWYEYIDTDEKIQLEIGIIPVKHRYFMKVDKIDIYYKKYNINKCV